MANRFCREEDARKKLFPFNAERGHWKLQFDTHRRYRRGQAGANFLFFRTHWLGMPLAHALASMRLMSDELLPALQQVKG